MANNNKYDESSIKSLDWKEHIRKRPGMYIGKTGNGSSQDDGIYILIKEILDNSIDEHIMGYGNRIEIKRNDNSIIIRDYGRGIPLGKVEDCVSKINTGGKYDSDAFKKSVGLNGVGIKAVNALSENFKNISSMMNAVTSIFLNAGGIKAELKHKCPTTTTTTSSLLNGNWSCAFALWCAVGINAV